MVMVGCVLVVVILLLFRRHEVHIRRMQLDVSICPFVVFVMAAAAAAGVEVPAVVDMAVAVEASGCGL